MLELNREEIIKDLECCKFGKDEAKCKECNWHPWIKPRCWRLLASNALALIKQLTEENIQFADIGKLYSEIRKEVEQDVAREIEAVLNKIFEEYAVLGQADCCMITEIIRRKLSAELKKKYIGEK